MDTVRASAALEGEHGLVSILAAPRKQRHTAHRVWVGTACPLVARAQLWGDWGLSEHWYEERVIA